MYFTKYDDGLSKGWGGHRVFINPPYGRQIGRWVQKGYEEAKEPNTLCVLLIPARTDTKWFHDYIYGKAEIRFLRGRVKFGEGRNCAPFPSMVVIYRNGKSLTVEKHGRWILKKTHEDEYGNKQFMYFCSECDASAYEFSQPYCHNCGAKMDEVE